MARTMIDLEEELQRIYGLVNELADQLANNRALVTQLTARSENVKGQAAHVGTGFPLRRFNLDISEEEFHSELEAFSSHLVLENQNLQHENKQLNGLLKEYEQTLETVMGKFRGIAHASQQHDLSLHSYYTSLLHSLQTAHSSAQLHDDTSLSTLLARLSVLLRSALRSMSGEDPDPITLDHLGLIPVPPDHLQPVGESSSPGSSPSAYSVPRGPASRVTPFPGFLPGTSGGYAGTEGRADWAMEREMEIMRLEEENRALRELLGIEKELPAPLEGAEDELKEEEKKEHDGESSSRRGSLTVEELEKDAEKEEEQMAALEQQFAHGAFASPQGGQREELLEDSDLAPGTGLGGAAGVGGRRRSVEGERPAFLAEATGQVGEAKEVARVEDGGPGVGGALGLHDGMVPEQAIEEEGEATNAM